MINVKIEIDDKQLQDSLAALIKSTPENVREALTNAALAVEAEAKERCPVGDTGNLRASISSDVISTDGNYVARIGSGLEYAPYVHQGTGLFAKDGNGRKNVPWTYYDDKLQRLIQTKGQKPQPFLEDAADAVRPELLTYFSNILRM